MSIFSLSDYLMGRDKTHATELSGQHWRNAEVTVKRANALLEIASAHDIGFDAHPETRSVVSSGWRPAAINAGIANAAPRSKHMTCEAVDIYDPDGDLDDWLMGADGQAALTKCGLWLEHPSATKSWSHLQIVPPRSGRRVFYP